LSIVIAAFSSDQPGARQFAIVAGAMFLLAFVFSTMVVLGAKELFLELFSYVLTGLGIVFLGGVVVEYVVASNLLGSTLGLAGNIILGVFQLSLLPSFVGYLRKELKQKASSRNRTRNVGIYVFAIGTVTYNAFTYLICTPYKELVLGVQGGGAIYAYYLLGAPVGILGTKLIRALYRRQNVVKIVVEG
jgi:hypothetical protein